MNMNSDFRISGNIVDVVKRRIYPGQLSIKNGRIDSINATDETYTNYILPGFIDGHIHIESSMLVPSEFARIAATHGTVATVSDPHEIANVLGLEGINFMIQNAKSVPFKFYFGAPSCVPATPFETAGARFTEKELTALFANDDILYLSEMMNVPGVLNDDPFEVTKLKLAKKYGKKVDGHSPELRGKDAKKYVTSGITTDHECVTLDEAREKISYGMTVQIREGSAAKNLDDLMPLIDEYPGKVMLCSDDRHPDDLVESHVRDMVVRCLKAGHDMYNTLHAACICAVQHYGLKVGLIREGDFADFIVVKDLDHFELVSTFINGIKVAEGSKPLLQSQKIDPINNFHTSVKTNSDFLIKAEPGLLQVIDVIDGQLVTRKKLVTPRIEDGFVISDPDNDILKIAVTNRYKNKKPVTGFISNFGLKSGAIASSVAHDSHNIIAIGTNDKDLCAAVNLIIKHKGGLSVIDGDSEQVLPLSVAGIMSASDGYAVGYKYAELDQLVKAMGSPLQSPFMTLSFMALLVIPELKLSDQGLFDGNTFQFTSLFVGSH